MPLSADERSALCAAAATAAANAYAPYSHFRVGAAVLSERGTHVGVNVENASYGLCLCAERAALAAAVAAGARQLRGAAVACIDAPDDAPLAARTPCGACRQWLLELAPEAEVLVCGVERVFTVEELLPEGFRLDG